MTPVNTLDRLAARARMPEVASCCLKPRSDVISFLVRMNEYSGPRHAHPEAQVSLLFSNSPGRLRLSTGSGQTVSTGCIAYFPSGEEHVIEWTGFTELLNFYWHGDALRELADQCGCKLPIETPRLSVDPIIQAIGQVVRDDFLWNTTLTPMLVDHSRTMIAARLFQLFRTTAKANASGLLSKKRLRQAVDVLVGSPEKSFSLLELARMCNASVFHFSHSFSAQMGKAPFAFQRELRMQKARNLLQETDLSVEEISVAVGCKSPSSFARTFRRSTRQSPRECRSERRVR